MNIILIAAITLSNAPLKIEQKINELHAKEMWCEAISFLHNPHLCTVYLVEEPPQLAAFKKQKNNWKGMVIIFKDKSFVRPFLRRLEGPGSLLKLRNRLRPVYSDYDYEAQREYYSFEEQVKQTEELNFMWLSNKQMEILRSPCYFEFHFISLPEKCFSDKILREFYSIVE